MPNPTSPFIVSGIITDANGQLANGADVFVLNLMTGESRGMLTNSAGEYSIDLGNAMQQGYSNKDIIFISAIKAGGGYFRAWKVQKQIDTSVGFINQNLSLVAQNPGDDLLTVSEHDSAFREHEALASAKRVMLMVPTSNGKFLPVKGQDDGSGQFGLLSAISG